MKPRPPKTVLLPLSRAIAAEPVPAMMIAPSAPPWAPRQAVTASFSALTLLKSLNCASTLRASASVVMPARPSPRATFSGATVEPAAITAAATTLTASIALEIDVDVGRGAFGLAKQPPFAVAQAGAAARRSAVDAEKIVLGVMKGAPLQRGSARLCRFSLTSAIRPRFEKPVDSLCSAP